LWRLYPTMSDDDSGRKGLSDRRGQDFRLRAMKSMLLSMRYTRTAARSMIEHRILMHEWRALNIRVTGMTS